MATKTKRPMSSQAQAAKAIRQELKAAFPYTTFSIVSQSFAGGDSVHIDWTDGPTTDEVEAFSGKYQYGHFDGMIDMYEYTNCRKDIPQSKYVQTQRGQSKEAFEAAVTVLNERFGYNLTVDKSSNYGELSEECRYLNFDNDWAPTHVYRLLNATSLVCRECKHPIMPTDYYCGECGSETPNGEYRKRYS